MQVLVRQRLKSVPQIRVFLQHLQHQIVRYRVSLGNFSLGISNIDLSLEILSIRVDAVHQVVDDTASREDVH